MVGSISVIHGAVTCLDANRFAHRSLVDKERLTDFLRSREKPLVSRAQAHAGLGDALTIDDATVASAEAAALARRFGHCVTLFVNPSYIVAGRPYELIELSCLLDRTRITRVDWRGREYQLGLADERGHFRRACKEQIRALADEASVRCYLAKIALALEVEDPEIPGFLRTLTRADLRQLIDAGVDVQNHGWSHRNIDLLTEGEVCDDLVMGREWLRDALGVEPDAYAVPDGAALPSARIRAAVPELWYCANAALPAGWL
ncbi:MAG TPA: polysaccharide deacetylase family protein, partial [Chthonomonadaceae bacterium]|nr:polysaccharide deacetylase family protein [Chthonomonadaceae bacterium]